MNKISGVYKITNTITGDFYIGSSRNVKQRLAVHRCISTWNKCPNNQLYLDMWKYDVNNFKFEIIEETSNLKEREQYWIDELRPSYNIRRANGVDIERYKEWYKAHHEECIVKNKASYSRLYLYKGETLTLKALSGRFHNHGIPHAWREAKKYLI